MSAVPVQYEFVSQYERVPPEAACEGCGVSAMLGLDHCHAHGWARGVLCMRCNQYIGSIDRQLTPRVSEDHFAALVAVRNRCPGCRPLKAADLERPGRRERENRMRKMAERLRCDLTISRLGAHATSPAIYTLILPEGRFEVLTSSDAALEFLASLEALASGEAA